MELLNTSTMDKRNGMLYPMMVVAAVAVIVFSIVGIATMMGWMPSALSGKGPEATSEAVPAAKPGAGRSRAAAGPAAVCSDCGVIESVRAVEMKGRGSGLGIVAGGVVGGVLGNQVGGGSGRTAMTIIGAGTGAYAGNEIEKNMNRSTGWQIHVRMNDGTTRTFYERSQPAFNVGQKVRVTERGIVPAG